MKKNKPLITFLLFSMTFLAHGQSELDYIFILKGCHYSGPDCYLGAPTLNYYYMKPVNLDAKFDISFTKSCYYELSQSGWNKILRLEKYADHNDRSLRLGWRTNSSTHEFEIGLYAHIKGEIESLSLEYYPEFNDYNTYYMRIKYNGMYVRAGDNSYCIKRKIFDSSVWYGLGHAKGAYFGGNEPAPHSMDMWVKNTEWNINSAYWDNGANKGFGESIFYVGESYSVFASNSIKAPLVNTNNSSKYTIIEAGANVSFVAGRIISLKPGFKAYNGSYFHAYISSDKDKIDTISNLFLAKEDIPSLKLMDDNAIDDNGANHFSFTNDDVTVYPNPNNGIFNVYSPYPKISLQIIDNMGKSIKTENLQSPGTFEIDISHLPKGLYIVKAQGSDQYIIKKVIFK